MDQDFEYYYDLATAREAYLCDKYDSQRGEVIVKESKIEETQSETEMTFTNGIADYLPF